MIQVTMNNETMTLSPTGTLEALVHQLQLDRSCLRIAINNREISSCRDSALRIKEGDRISIEKREECCSMRQR